MKKYTFFLFTLFFFFTLSVSAQQIISSAAGDANGISWTIGEPVTETIITGDAMLTQGFNPAAIYSPVNLEIIHQEPGLVIFPNPVIDILNIACVDSQEFTWQLVNLLGQKIITGQSGTGNATVDMTAYPVGNYLLTVTSQEKTTSTIIIKK